MTAALLDGDPVQLTGIKKLVRGKTWDPIIVLTGPGPSFTPLDLSGWDGVRCDLRFTAGDAQPAVPSGSVVCTVLDLVGGAYVGEPTGRLKLKLSAAASVAIATTGQTLKGDPEFYKEDPDDAGVELVRSPCWFEVTLGEEYTKPARP